MVYKCKTDRQILKVLILYLDNTHVFVIINVFFIETVYILHFTELVKP